MASTHETFEKHFREAIKASVEEIIRDEAEQAATKVRARINKQIDMLALNILKTYDVSSAHDKLIITVRKIEI